MQKIITDYRIPISKNPYWKGGMSDLAHSIRTCAKNTYWKGFCRERDNYTCQKCGAGGYVEVHHCKIPFWKILEGLITQGIEQWEDISADSELWDTENGSTLCTDCHKEFHSICGNDFTKEDFEEWIN